MSLSPPAECSRHGVQHRERSVTDCWTYRWVAILDQFLIQKDRPLSTSLHGAFSVCCQCTVIANDQGYSQGFDFSVVIIIVPVCQYFFLPVTRVINTIIAYLIDASVLLLVCFIINYELTGCEWLGSWGVKPPTKFLTPPCVLLFLALQGVD